MCKLLCLTNTKKINLTADKLQKLAAILTIGQNDGLGIAIKTKTNTWIHKGYDSDKSLHCIGKHANINKTGFSTKSIMNNGNIPVKSLSMIMHSRTSTNSISLDSTHPFKLNDNFVFAHNGIINIPTKHNYKTLTNNDSEYLAHDYFTRGANKALSEIRGYAAIMAFNKDGIEVYKDNTAELHVTYSALLDTYLITTKFGDAMKLGEILAKDFTIPEKVEDYCFVRFNYGSSFVNLDKKIEKLIKSYNISETLIEKSIGLNTWEKDIYDHEDIDDEKYEYKLWNDKYGYNDDNVLYNDIPKRR